MFVHLCIFATNKSRGKKYFLDCSALSFENTFEDHTDSHFNTERLTENNCRIVIGRRQGRAWRSSKCQQAYNPTGNRFQVGFNLQMKVGCEHEGKKLQMHKWERWKKDGIKRVNGNISLPLKCTNYPKVFFALYGRVC